MRRRTGASLSEIEAVYRKRFPEFRRVAAAIVGDRDAALDVVQDAFGRALRRRRTYRGEGPLEAWIWRMVVNAAIDYRRPRPVAAPVEPDRSNGQVETSAALAAAIALLPERQRLALFLRYYADLDYASIAEALGVKPGTVAASLNAAHAALRRALTEVAS
jgi:RNA polymerase sigma-70 factor (ECF subfamily)